jgi:hypothetical protein
MVGYDVASESSGGSLRMRSIGKGQSERARAGPARVHGTRLDEAGDESINPYGPRRPAKHRSIFAG